MLPTDSSLMETQTGGSNSREEPHGTVDGPACRVQLSSLVLRLWARSPVSFTKLQLAPLNNWWQYKGGFRGNDTTARLLSSKSLQLAFLQPQHDFLGAPSSSVASLAHADPS